MSSEIKTSNLSYTNKDFQEAYVELLEKAKELSYHWDPTISNESDPGVVLIKELAIAIDKLNYNCDKNALENYPLSTTQDGTSREIFNLLGYSPKWYRSACQSIALAYTGEAEKDVYITLPLFTAITNGEYTYTIPSTPTISLDGSIATCQAYEGTLETVTVNGETVLTLANIDSDNRIYLNDYSVAENCIYVSNFYDGEISLNFWNKVDNLKTCSLGEFNYQFGIDTITGACYVEFPEDIANLIGEGISVSYLVSNGTGGKVSTGELTTLKDSSVSVIADNNEEIILNSTNISITNIGQLVDGKNPETIDEMYDNYKHIVGTFDTLVTLRDYTNALYNTEKVSNGFVTDRTNDIQDSYKIVKKTATTQGVENVVEETTTTKIYPAANGSGDVAVSVSTPKLQPFDLKIYALQYVGDITNKNDYDTTFQIYADLDANDFSSSLYQLTTLLNDTKCMSINYNSIETDKICLLKNRYEIDVKIISVSNLTNYQKQDIKQNIINALYKHLNARTIDFGKEIDYDSLYSIIENSDNRIKTILLDDIEYNTYAVYYDSGAYGGTSTGWKEICISNEPQFYLSGYYYSGDFYWDETHTKPFESKYVSKNETYLDLTDDKNNIYLYNTLTGAYSLYSTRRNDFRAEIFAKNILCGATPYLVDDGTPYKYSINQQGEPLQNYTNISTKLSKTFVLSQNNQDAVEVRNHETIRFIRPNLIDVLTYSSYIKYEYIGDDISKNTIHKLASDEKIIFYYKNSDDDEYYSYEAYGQGTIISPSFRLQRTTDSSDFVNVINLGTLTDTVKSGVRQRDGDLTNTGNLGAVNTVVIKRANTSRLGLLNSGTPNYCYWITSNVDNDTNEYVMEYVYNGSEYVYTLGEGEYFIHTNSNMTSMVTFGAGTKLVLNLSNNQQLSTIQWRVPVVATAQIYIYGVDALRSYWYTFYNDQIDIYEQQFINVGEGGLVRIRVNDNASLEDITIEGTDGTIIMSENYYESSVTTDSTTIVFDDAISSITPTDMQNLLTYMQTTVVDGGGQHPDMGYTPNESYVTNTDIFLTYDGTSAWSFKDLYDNTFSISTTDLLTTALNIPDGITNMVENDVVDFHYKCITPADVSSSDFTFEYRLLGENDYTVLEKSNDENLDWNIALYLDIDCGLDNPQYIEDGQEVTLYNDNNSTKVLTEDSILVASEQLYFTGENLASLQLVDQDTLKTYYPDFYAYEEIVPEKYLYGSTITSSDATPPQMNYSTVPNSVIDNIFSRTFYSGDVIQFTSTVDEKYTFSYGGDDYDIPFEDFQSALALDETNNLVSFVVSGNTMTITLASGSNLKSAIENDLSISITDGSTITFTYNSSSWSALLNSTDNLGTVSLDEVEHLLGVTSEVSNQTFTVTYNNMSESIDGDVVLSTTNGKVSVAFASNQSGSFSTILYRGISFGDRGNMIIPIRVSSDTALKTLKVYTCKVDDNATPGNKPVISDVTYLTEYISGNSSLTSPGSYYLSVSLEDVADIVNSQFNIGIDIEGVAGDSVTIDNFKKYLLNEYLPDSLESAVYGKLQALTAEHSNYDLLYSVDDNNSVYNPLDGKEFFNVNHFYNQFTIPQINNVLFKVVQ